MTRTLIASILFAAALPVAAQAPTSAGQPPVAQEGFFRPSEDPALTRWGAQAPAQGGNNGGLDASPAARGRDAGDVAAMQAAMALREAQELELERAERAHAAAQAILAARVPPPAIVSPLDGSAAIIDPLER